MSRSLLSRLAVASWRALCSLVLVAVFSTTRAQAQTDTVSPTVAVTSPTSGTRLSSATTFPTVSGTAGDNVGVTSVTLRLVRLWTSGGWNGTAWQSTTYNLPTTVTGTGTGGATTTATWSCSATMPTGTDIVPGQYTLQAIASDAAGHQTSSTVTTTIIGADSTAPTGSITSPITNTVYIPSDTLSYGGTVQEETGGSGLWRVYGSLTRTHNGTLQYWNGTAWASSGNFFTAATLSAPDTNGIVTWSSTATQPPAAQREQGMETFYAVLQDRSGNARTLSLKYYISPEDHVAPTLSMVGPSSSERLSSTGVSSAASTNGLGLSNLLKGQTADDANGSGVWQMQAVLTCSWSGVTQYWNGSTWSTSNTTFNVPLSVADAGGTGDGDNLYNWSLASAMPSGGGLPSGTLLPAGQYSISVTTFDRYSNTAQILRPFYINPSGGSDSTAPLVTVSTPANNSTYGTGQDPATPPTSLTGKVRDPNSSDGTPASGVGRLNARLCRNWSGTVQYWNGSTWSGSDTPYSISVNNTPDNDGSGNYSWSISNVPVPSGANLPAGRYYFLVLAYDRSNNQSSTLTYLKVGSSEVTPPIGTITSPAAGASLSHLTQVTGTVSDPTNPDGSAGVGVGRVNVTLRKSEGGITKYWTGQGTPTNPEANWSATYTTLPGDGELGWTRNQGLPADGVLAPGAYSIYVDSIDRSNNVGTVSRSFSIVALVATGQSVNVPYETATSLTLAATSAGDSALTWSIVTPPAHGTLSGTAPNLTYTPMAGFGADDTFTFNVSDAAGTSNTATVTLTVSSPVPLDAMLAPGSSATTPLPMSSFVGLGIANTTGQSQSVTRSGDAGSATDFTVLLRKGIGSDDVIVSATPMTDGWSASYFYGAADITNSVEGNGWTHSFATDDEARLRVAVTPPATAVEGASKELLIHARNATANTGEDAVKAIVTAHGISLPDAEIKLQSDTDYLGHEIISSTAANQTRTVQTPVGTTQVFPLKVRNKGVGTGHFKVTGPASSQGWTVHYFDALTGGTDITSQLTSGGWTTPDLASDASVELRLEVTPPLTADEGDSQGLLIHATNVAQGSSDDAVKAMLSVHGIPQPDAEIKVQGDAVYLGHEIINSIAYDQTVTVQTPVGITQIFPLKVRNRGAVAAPLKVTGPASSQGWTVHYFDALTGGTDITADVTGAGWMTPSLAPDASVELRMEVTPTAAVVDEKGFVVTTSSSHAEDVVQANCTLPQFIAKLQWSDDGGDTWTDLPASGIVQAVQGAPFGLKAIPGKPLTTSPWPDEPNMKPEWHNGGDNDAMNVGDEIGFQYDEVTGSNAQGQPLYHEIRAECGNIVKAQVLVVPFAKVDLSFDDSTIAALNPATGVAGQTDVTALVTDWLGTPLPNIHVHFTTTSGIINAAGTADDNAVTDAQGYASVTLTAGAIGTAHLTANVITTAPGTPAGLTVGDPALGEVQFQ